MAQGADGGGGGLDAFSSEELADALKLALQEGVEFACNSAMQAGGFMNNANIHIPLPEEVNEVAEKLREIGMGNLIDEFVEKLNKAAEEAAGKVRAHTSPHCHSHVTCVCHPLTVTLAQAVDICVNAVKNMSVDDAINILKGEADACTQFLIRTCRGPVLDLMRPIVTEVLGSCGVIAAWEAMQSGWGAVPDAPFMLSGGKPHFPDKNIEDYALEKGGDGIFFLCAEKEKEIRDDAGKAANELVTKVFSAITRWPGDSPRCANALRPAPRGGAGQTRARPKQTSGGLY